MQKFVQWKTNVCGSCIRGIKGHPVEIDILEQYVNDWAEENNIEHKIEKKNLNKKVAVIGSGPAGIACTYELAKKGYNITIFERHAKCGGILTYGIPDYRLDKKTIENVINKLKNLNVKIKNNVEFGKDITIESLKEEGYQAIFLGIGAEIPTTYDLGVKSDEGIITSTDILYSYSNGKKLDLGTVAVIGGGNVAIDSARVAKRMGAKKVYILYRRNRALMPARDIEIEDALKDGIEIIYNTKVVKAHEEKGKVKKITCIKTKIEDDKIIDIENSKHDINVDTVVFAIGLKPKLDFNIEQENGLIKIDEYGKTSAEGVFAGGDVVHSKLTVCKAVSEGKKAAEGIDNYLQDKEWFYMEENLLIPNLEDETEEKNEFSLRPKLLREYIGQTKVKENLKVYIEAAKKRNEPLDHVLLYGPPGLGKTTLANIIATEMNSNIRITSGPAIEKPGDLAALLTNLAPNDVLFIDEIHRLNKSVEEILYPALEDYNLDIIIGKGPSARSIRLDLPKFTLVGATTKAGSLTTPLRDRFGIVHRLELYDEEELKTIVKRSSEIMNISIDEEGALEIARRSRGTPRIANRLLKRVRDYASVLGDGNINVEIARTALQKLEIDDLGLDNIDRKILESIILNYGGGPVGLETLAATIGEETETLEDVYEPYLMQKGFLGRTPRGRIATEKAYKHLGLQMME